RGLLLALALTCLVLKSSLSQHFCSGILRAAQQDVSRSTPREELLASAITCRFTLLISHPINFSTSQADTNSKPPAPHLGSIGNGSPPASAFSPSSFQYGVRGTSATPSG